MPDCLVALLPLKVHSARIPEKNFRDFHGKPLTRWILETLLEISGIKRIIINTDARERLKNIGVSDSDRVQIRDRKPSLCGDEVSMNLILADDIRAQGQLIACQLLVSNCFSNTPLACSKISRISRRFSGTGMLACSSSHSSA